VDCISISHTNTSYVPIGTNVAIWYPLPLWWPHVQLGENPLLGNQFGHFGDKHYSTHLPKCVAFNFGFCFWCSGFIFWFSQNHVRDSRVVDEKVVVGDEKNEKETTTTKGEALKIDEGRVATADGLNQDSKLQEVVEGGKKNKKKNYLILFERKKKIDFKESWVYLLYT
jgi:hypothetical protein